MTDLVASADDSSGETIFPRIGQVDTIEAMLVALESERRRACQRAMSAGCELATRSRSQTW